MQLRTKRERGSQVFLARAFRTRAVRRKIQKMLRRLCVVSGDRSLEDGLSLGED